MANALIEKGRAFNRDSRKVGRAQLGAPARGQDEAAMTMLRGMIPPQPGITFAGPWAPSPFRWEHLLKQKRKGGYEDSQRRCGRDPVRL
jgi:hypothetical protein